MKVTLITLNYNSAAHVVKLLDSLEKQTDKDFKIIVADNGCEDVKDLRAYAAAHPHMPIQVLENGANLGYAGGNNPALRQAFQDGSAWALVLNPDTWVEDDFIVRLKANLKDREGLVGLPIREDSQVAYGGGIEWLKAPSELQHIYDPHANVAKKYVIGAAMAISRSAYDQLGPMDEEYFLYFEDADYSVRAYEFGVPVSYCHGPIVEHAVSQTTTKLGSPLLLRYHYRNALYFNYKNAPLFMKVLTVPWSVVIALKQIFKIMSGDHVIESKAILNGIIDFYQEKMGRISTKTKITIECESIEGKNPQWGIGKIIIRLLEELSKRPELVKDFEFTLYFKDSVPDFSFLKNPLFKTKTVPVPGKPNRLFPFYYYLLLPIQLWLDRNDVMFWPNYMLPIIAFGKSYVILTEDIYYEGHEGALPFRYRIAYRIFGGWTAYHATKILAISETSKNNVAQLWDIDLQRLAVNHLGIDPIDATHKERGDYILYVGQAFPRRHLREAMQAFRKLAPEFPQLTFRIIGVDKYPTPMLKPLQHEINTELGREAIIHRNYVSQKELEAAYAGARALLYISDREAFGLPPMEALSLGVPAVVADNLLGHELLEDSGIFVCNPNSVEETAQAIREAMTNSELREKIKEHGPKIAARYTWEAFTDRFLETIKSLAHHA